jgi:ATP-dependent DNA ligase
MGPGLGELRWFPWRFTTFSLEKTPARSLNRYRSIRYASAVLAQFVGPMMASVVKEPFDHRDWIFETKLDGFRALAVIDSTGKARLWSRDRLPLEQKFRTVQEAINQLGLPRLAPVLTCPQKHSPSL